MRGFGAGLVYFAAIFLLGFVLGVVRTLLLGAFPGLSRLLLVLIEVPVILGVAWIVSGVVLRHFALSTQPRAAIVMGAFALLLLLLAEAALSMGLGGLTLGQHLALYAQPSHLVGLLAQGVFAALPRIRVAGAASYRC